MNHKTTTAAVLLSLSALLLGCDGPPSGEELPVSIDRTIADAPDPTFSVEGGLTDTILLRPGPYLEVRDGLIALIDHGRMAVEAFDTTGALLWLAGKEGDGPLELRDPVDLTIDDRGHVWVQDRTLRKVIEIRPGGDMGAPIRPPPVREYDRPQELLALSGDRFAVQSSNGEFVVWYPERNEIDRPNNPFEHLDEHHPMVRQSFLVRGPDDHLTTVFYLGGGFQHAAIGESFDTLHPYAEAIPFPELVQERLAGTRGVMTTTSARYRAALDASISNGVLHVLFEGSTPNARRLIDRYDARSGRYLGTWLLEEPASAVAADAGMLVTVEGRTIPKLVIRRIPGS